MTPSSQQMEPPGIPGRFIGAAAAFWVAGITTVFALLSIFNVYQFLKADALLDAVVFAVLGFFVLKKMSRAAAVIALVGYIIERVYMAITRGPSAGVGGVAIVFLLLLITGVRGTFAYHRYREQPSSDLTAARAA